VDVRRTDYYCNRSYCLSRVQSTFYGEIFLRMPDFVCSTGLNNGLGRGKASVMVLAVSIVLCRGVSKPVGPG
jgi:hypothetical protein